jgi:hypothetical protein
VRNEFIIASISERVRAGGRKAFVVQIIRRGQDNYRDSQTFDNLKEAQVWARKREAEIDLTTEEGRDLRGPKIGKATLGEAIDKYVKEQRFLGKTKSQCLRTIRKEYAISEKACETINSTTVVEFARQVSERPEVNSPATVSNYMAHLSAVFKHASALWAFALDESEMNRAHISCKHIGLIGKPKERNRRPGDVVHGTNVAPVNLVGVSLEMIIAQGV